MLLFFADALRARAHSVRGACGIGFAYPAQSSGRLRVDGKRGYIRAKREIPVSTSFGVLFRFAANPHRPAARPHPFTLSLPFAGACAGASARCSRGACIKTSTRPVLTPLTRGLFWWTGLDFTTSKACAKQRKRHLLCTVLFEAGRIGIIRGSNLPYRYSHDRFGILEDRWDRRQNKGSAH